jgi:hypothetical protein
MSPRLAGVVVRFSPQHYWLTAMSVEEACDFFGKGAALAILTRMRGVGLGYLSLGQPFTTLSAVNGSGSSSPSTWRLMAGSMCLTSRPVGCI